MAVLIVWVEPQRMGKFQPPHSSSLANRPQRATTRASFAQQQVGSSLTARRPGALTAAEKRGHNSHSGSWRDAALTVLASSVYANISFCACWASAKSSSAWNGENPVGQCLLSLGSTISVDVIWIAVTFIVNLQMEIDEVFVSKSFRSESILVWTSIVLVNRYLNFDTDLLVAECYIFRINIWQRLFISKF
ncbi:hypothetical protein RRG08_052514 [Elysia crispata]|uniref:Uncharacterized protein n=1 Tax=Elysia crispata TaxID=231223 RepID=A0AAE0ZH04_9GAST|nr:hypothetical protein RRG08_052514 [Elysia crispata]